MSFPVLAASAGISALGQIGGALIAGQQEGPTTHEQAVSAFVAQSDPVIAGLRLESLAQLGQPVDGILRTASPIGQLINVGAQTSDIRRDDLDEIEQFANFLRGIADEAARQGVPPSQILSSENLSELARQAAGPTGGIQFNAINAVKAGISQLGYSSVGAFLDAEVQYQAKAREVTAVAQQVSSLSNQQKVQLLQLRGRQIEGFPEFTAEELERRESDAFQGRIADIRNARDEAGEDLAQQANVLGFNPGRGFGEINERAQIQTLQARDESFERALRLLEGETNIASQGLNTIEGAISEQQARGLRPANISVPSLLTAAQQAAGLAGGVSGLGGSGTNPLGAGVATGANSIANSLTLASLLDRFGGQNAPGGPTAPVGAGLGQLG